MLSLCITLIITTSLSGLYKLVSHSQNIQDFHEDIYIGVKQTSQYVLGTRYREVGSFYQYIDYDNQENELIFDNHRLVKTPGYEILITNIQGGYFEIVNGHIYMIIERNDKSYRFLLTYAKEYIEEVENEDIENNE